MSAISVYQSDMIVYIDSIRYHTNIFMLSRCKAWFLSSVGFTDLSLEFFVIYLVYVEKRFRLVQIRNIAFVVVMYR